MFIVTYIIRNTKDIKSPFRECFWPVVANHLELFLHRHMTDLYVETQDKCSRKMSLRLKYKLQEQITNYLKPNISIN